MGFFTNELCLLTPVIFCEYQIHVFSFMRERKGKNDDCKYLIHRK